jgi:hypothetical protein
MAVMTIKVPSRQLMARGIGQTILNGVEYEVLGDNLIELTSGDEARLERLAAAFGGGIVSKVTMKYVQTELPKHEA